VHSILVVESCPELRSRLKKQLSYLNIYTIDVSNGIQALRVLNELHPDLVISDIDVPHMFGVEFSTLLKINPETWHLPVVLYSANYADSDPDGMLRQQADAVLAKPLNETSLI
jgi:CheY-like chemotaxis protein